jgi:hypothetical protein
LFFFGTGLGRLGGTRSAIRVRHCGGQRPWPIDSFPPLSWREHPCDSPPSRAHLFFFLQTSPVDQFLVRHAKLPKL